MDYEQNRIKQWMRRIGQETPERPIIPDLPIVDLRMHLIEEEFRELMHAAEDYSLESIADALADLVVVVKGTAVAFGIDLQPVLEEVFRSNDSKCIDGHKREDGKWMKGPSYVPPNLEPIIRKQMEE